MATSINTYSVGLYLDAKDYIHKSDLAGKETAKLSRMINAARDPYANYARAINLVTKARTKNAMAQSTANALYAVELRKLEKATKGIHKVSEAWSAGLAKVGKSGADIARAREGTEAWGAGLRKMLPPVRDLSVLIETMGKSTQRASRVTESWAAGLAKVGRTGAQIAAAKAGTEAWARGMNRMNPIVASVRHEMTQIPPVIGSWRKHLTSFHWDMRGAIKLVRDLHIAILGIRQAVMAISAPIKAFAEFEQIEAQFEVLVGNADRAEKLMQGIRDLAATSPLTFRGVGDAARTMLQFGVATKDVLPYLRMLGDITGGNTERFKNLNLAFSQMQAAGRLLGQDLRQMTDAGFNPLSQGVIETGKSFSELLDMQRDGMLSSELITKWFKSATSEGGRFSGMLDTIDKKSQGAIARLQSQIEILSIEMGRSLAPATIETAEAFKGMNGPILEVTDNIGVMVKGLAALSNTGSGAGLSEFSEFLTRYYALPVGKDHALGGLKTLLSSTVTNLKHAADMGNWFFDSLVSGEEKARESMLKVQEWGRAILPAKWNKDLDDYVAKMKEVADAEAKKAEAEDDKKRQDEAKAKAAKELNEAYDNQVSALEKQLKLLRAGVKEGEYMDARLDGMNHKQAMHLAQLNKQIDAFAEAEEARKKAAEDKVKLEKEAADKAEAAEKEVIRLKETAYKNATKYYDEERKKQRKLLADWRGASVDSFEVGTEGAFGMRAQLFNQNQIDRSAAGRGLAGADVEPSTRDLVDETKKQLAQLQIANTKQDTVITTLDKILTEQKQNGIRKAR